MRSNVFVWLPLIYFLVLLSLTNKFQIGIRHAMILLPFLYIGIAPTMNVFVQTRRILFYVLCSLQVISIARYWPNIMAYTNELIWDKKKAYHIMRDSSIDYGQANPWLIAFRKEHPEYKRPTNIPHAGKFAIAIGQLYAEREGEINNIAWLRRFEPVGHYRYSILLFNITQEQLLETK